MSTCTPLGTYTNEPPDQTAVLSAAYLLSAEGMIVPKYFLKISGYSLNAESVSRKITPSLVHSSGKEWEATSDSYWSPAPARNLRSASGMPNRSKVFLISAGTASQSVC